MSDTDEFFEWMDAVFEEEYNVSITENGAAGYRTTGKHLLDLHFAVSSLLKVNIPFSSVLKDLPPIVKPIDFLKLNNKNIIFSGYLHNYVNVY